jgi:flagellar biogenesis protein FliO
MMRKRNFMRGVALICLACLLAAASGIAFVAPARGAAADGPARPLPPRTRTRAIEQKTASKSATRDAKPTSGWMTTGGGLVIVVGLILIGAKLLRHRGFSATASLPNEVVQVLGRKPVDYRHTIHLVRCGSRLLVLGSSQTGLTTLSEITDTAEVEQICELCQSFESRSMPESFGQILNRIRGGNTPASAESAERDAAILRLRDRVSSEVSDVDDVTTTSSTREDVG